MSAEAIITGTFTYPPCAGVPGTGQLIVAKSALWNELPYEMLAFAQDNAVFPHASTADQFFDAGQRFISPAVNQLHHRFTLGGYDAEESF